MTYINPSEVPRRIAILKRTFKLCERQHDDEVIEGAVAATSKLTVPQLEAACTHVVTNDPKGPLVRGILMAVDATTKIAQRKADAEREIRVLPMVTIDTTRTKQQVAILERYAKPASKATWTQAELDEIRLDLELDARRGLGETWIEKQRSKHPPLELDPAQYGPPPDPADDRIPDDARRAELAAQLRARISHLERTGAGPRRVAGLRSLGAAVRDAGTGPADA